MVLARSRRLSHTRTVKLLTVPNTPTGLAAIAGDAVVSLTWNSQPDAASYNVYQGTSSNGESLVQSGLLTPEASVTSLTNTTTYYFKVAAVNAAGVSSLSSEVSATPTVSTATYPSDQSTIVTDDDTVPNFTQTPTIYSTGTGNWSSTGTWDLGRVPQAGDIVGIKTTHVVTYDVVSTAAIVGVGVAGKLQFRTDIDTKLTYQNLLIYGPETLGAGNYATLQIGTSGTPVNASKLAELVFSDVALIDSGAGQYSNGLLCWGICAIQGATKTGMVRLSAAPAASDTTVSFGSAVTGWAVGDKLVIPDSLQRAGDTKPAALGVDYVSQSEIRTASAIAGNSLSATVPALTYAHPAAYDADGTTIRILPHTANLTRNVLIRSASATGHRGHCQFYSRVKPMIRYAEFRNLGRTIWADHLNDVTNHVGRYPVHFHHLENDSTSLFDGVGSLTAYGSRFVMEGCSVWDDTTHEAAFKWGITVHNTSYGTIKHNVIFNHGGAAIMFEDGTESGNLLEGNFICACVGDTSRPDTRGSPLEYGYEGFGIWQRTTLNIDRNNVVADSTYGSIYYLNGLDSATVPIAPGSGSTHQINMMNTPLTELSGFECYGGRMEAGLELWSLGTNGVNPYSDAQLSTVSNFTCWHIFAKGVYNYETAHLTFDGVMMRGMLNKLYSRCYAFFSGDYVMKDYILTNADVQGFFVGFEFSNQSGHGTQEVRNSTFVNWRNFQCTHIYRYGAEPQPGPERQNIIRNVLVSNMATPDPGELGLKYHIYMDDAQNADAVWFTQIDELRVYDWNGNSGEDYQVYYDGQLSTAIVPTRVNNYPGSVKVYGTPVAGLTNAQTWQTYMPDTTLNADAVTKPDAPNPNTPGMAVAGSKMPAGATALAGVQGKVVAI